MLVHQAKTSTRKTSACSGHQVPDLSTPDFRFLFWIISILYLQNIFPSSLKHLKNLTRIYWNKPWRINVLLNTMLLFSFGWNVCHVSVDFCGVGPESVTSTSTGSGPAPLFLSPSIFFLLFFFWFVPFYKAQWRCAVARLLQLQLWFSVSFFTLLYLLLLHFSSSFFAVNLCLETIFPSSVTLNVRWSELWLCYISCNVYSNRLYPCMIFIQL